MISVLSERSVDHADEMYDFFVDNGITVVGFNIEELEGAHLESSVATPGFSQRYAALARFYERVQRDGMLAVREFDYFENRMLNPRARSNDQVQPLAILSVDATGNFSTFSPELLDTKSDRHGDFILGNVLGGGFLSALGTEKFARICAEIGAGVQACRAGCEHFIVCGGGAPSNELFENGSMDTSVTDYCRYCIPPPRYRARAHQDSTSPSVRGWSFAA